jgi:hypothetical protein
MEFPLENTIRLPRPTPVAALLAAAAPFRALGRTVVDLGDRLPVMVALGRLQETGDQTPPAQGLTRMDEVRRILGPRAFF